jgi:hypothetical protein
MNTRALPALFSLTLLSALPWPQSVRADSGLMRCENADGSVAYTDRGCAAPGSKSVPVSGELLSRLASERSREPQTSEQGYPNAFAVHNAGRRSPAAGCARSKKQLLADLEGSFALGDVNRLAESYHWVGKSNRQAQQQMLQLERMAHEGLMDAALFDARIDSFAGNDSTAMLQLTLGKGSVRHVVDLDVLRYSGCYFARI